MSNISRSTAARSKKRKLLNGHSQGSRLRQTPFTRNFNDLWDKLHALHENYCDLVNVFGSFDVDRDLGGGKTDDAFHDQQHGLTPRQTCNSHTNTNIRAFLHELILIISLNVCRNLICRISTTVKTTINRTPLNSMSRLAREK